MALNLPNLPFKEKQVKTITIVLGTITTLLVALLSFRVVSDTVFVRASNFKPKNVAITEIQKNSSRIKWATDSETQSVVEYGNSPTSLTFFAPEATKTKDHSVELNLLTAGNTYYFQIRTGDKVFDNEGVPWTFTTLEKNSQPSASPSAEVSDSGVTVVPSAQPSGSVSAAPSNAAESKDTKCDLKEYQNYYGQNISRLDQDNNKIVNFQDWSACKVKNQGVTTTTPTPITAVPQETTITASSSLDNYLTKNITSGTITLGSLNNELQIGKNNTTSSRGFIGFTSIPTDITVDQAKLKLYQNRTTGLPFNNNGSLVIDNYNFGTSVDADDWDKTSTDVLIAQNIATISAGDSETWREIDVTSAMQANATAKRSTASFRLRFSNDGVAADSSSGDYVYFGSSESLAKAPQLYIKYRKTS